MTDAEKRVREVWQTPVVGRSHGGDAWYVINRYPGTQLLTPGENYRTRKLAWSAARDFTEDRLEEIRQLREVMIYVPESEMPQGCVEFIISRLRRELEQLRQGLKPEVLK